MAQGCNHVYMALPAYTRLCDYGELRVAPTNFEASLSLSI